MEEAYTTVWAEASATFTEKKSRFIGHIAPVQNEGEALTYLNGLRTKYWDANHNVYAYITREGNITRCSDDGEPQGTGGVPVLGVLQKEGLTDVIAVVTRYFGGTLLGVGGLVRPIPTGQS
ncbi:YigZ family protein [Akkermansia muciniphila]|uniref:YigZ family protein n=1 Tax=Akkermansia muciniphila TaxID=239935 RepID=UPI001961327F